MNPLNSWTEFKTNGVPDLQGNALKIIAKLGGITNVLNDTKVRKSKTELIKMVLAELGNELKFSVAVNGIDVTTHKLNDEKREVLFDMTWYVKGRNEYSIHSIPMAL